MARSCSTHASHTVSPRRTGTWGSPGLEEEARCTRRAGRGSACATAEGGSRSQHDARLHRCSVAVVAEHRGLRSRIRWQAKGAGAAGRESEGHEAVGREKGRTAPAGCNSAADRCLAGEERERAGRRRQFGELFPRKVTETRQERRRDRGEKGNHRASKDTAPLVVAPLSFPPSPPRTGAGQKEALGSLSPVKIEPGTTRERDMRTSTLNDHSLWGTTKRQARRDEAVRASGGGQADGWASRL